MEPKHHPLKPTAPAEEKKEKIPKPLTYTMGELMKKQAEDIRARILRYRVVSARLNPKYNYDELPNHCDILLFGPSGSGKSSLIRTFYQALYSMRTLSPEIDKAIVVKGEKHNEGTTHYAGVHLKEEMVRAIDTPMGKVEERTSAIVIHDTRGQIWMDGKELAQLDLIIQVKLLLYSSFRGK